MRERGNPSCQSSLLFPPLLSPVNIRRPILTHDHAHLLRVLQSAAKRRALGLVSYVPIVANYFCLALPEAFTQPGVHLLVKHRK